MEKLKCNNCYETKLVTEFSKCRSRKTGYQGKCKSCNKTTISTEKKTKIIGHMNLGISQIKRNGNTYQSIWLQINQLRFIE